MADTKDIAFVRHDMLPEQAPPASETGIIKWVRQNLFSNVWNSILTVIALWFIYKIVSGAWPWVTNGVWSTSSLAECREILQGNGGGCFSVLTERWNQLLFGFQYPTDAYWRPVMAFILLGVAVAPVLFRHLPRKLMIFTGLYPFIGFYLIWGGTILIPIMALAGFVAGYFAFKRFEH